MKRIIIFGIIWIAFCWTAKASLIDYTLSGTGSGSLGAVPFSDTAFTITSTADTANITESLGVFQVPDITATVFVSGLGSATFTIPTDNFDTIDFTPGAGISSPNQHRDILDISSSAFASYDLSSSLSPVTGTPSINSGTGFQTTAGNFLLSSISSVTFRADVVPEPSTFALLGVVSVGWVLWRQKHKTMPPNIRTACKFSAVPSTARNSQ
ncbi:MAG TPA: PEP-CTERM sorting domain-containing protein [Verrucomicrobiae bacterium]|nr:PEP-CTERM sorting domain-containing protein [Verrucomicrobiae bacterium]